ncbi:ribosome maturation factor RimP [Artemisia annua]|uniref:Ribosome maturation factor RimP n=1 Tax=Artemisia annua TaxID=35608 RepID=A0A2U1LYN5_ARTAN|nr:ribosome maturation factor RimP [Artemisia annua]
MGGSTLNLQTTLLYPSNHFTTKPINLKLNKIPYFTSFSSFNNSRCNNVVSVPAKKKKNPSFDEEEQESVIISPSIVDEVSQDDEFYEFDDDEEFDEDDDFEDDYLDEDADPRAGDGGGGGGISLAGTTWDKEALTMAEQVLLSFDGELGIYAFKTLQNSAVRVRIERLTNKSGSPDMEDIEAFSKAYQERLNEAEIAGSIPDISLEVSSPGLERVVRIPEDLERFKDRPMYVRYMTPVENDATPSSERDGVLRLESFDLEAKCCTWGLADVRVNREKAGKGRPLSKKQREWRLDTPFDSLLLVRIHAQF